MKKNPAAPAIAEPQQPQPSTAPGEWVDDRELAARTPFTRTAWQTWRHRGKGPPFYQVGKRCLYRWAEVCAWMESHRVEPKAS